MEQVVHLVKELCTNGAIALSQELGQHFLSQDVFVVFDILYLHFWVDRNNQTIFLGVSAKNCYGKEQIYGSGAHTHPSLVIAMLLDS